MPYYDGVHENQFSSSSFIIQLLGVINQSVFIQFLKLKCQNLSYSFIYPTMYHLLTYVFSKLSYKCLKLFSFLGHPVVFQIFRKTPNTVYVNTLGL